MKKILIIEDSVDIRENTAEILELAGYAVTTAENGKTGVEMAKQVLPDLILCDIMMPELDGYGVINILSKNPQTETIPFIFFSAKAEKEDFRKGMNLGADDYITKPFTDIDLMEAIESRLRKTSKMRTEPEAPGFPTGGLEALNALKENRKTKTFKKKEEIFRQDDYANYLFYILSGRVKSVKTDSYGKTFVNDLFGANAYIGYTTLLEEDGEYHETAIAMTDTEVAMIPKSDFVDLVRKNREVALKFFNDLSGNLQARDKRLLQLAYTPVRERVAHAVLLIKEKMMEQEHADGIRISRDDLASIVGTAKESLIRMLSEIRKEGLIDTDGHLIKIVDEKGLRKIVGSW